MKNLYVCSFVAMALASAACSRSSHSNLMNNKPGANNKSNVVGSTAELPLARAAAAFKAEGYDANKAENKALAADIGGADMAVVGPEKVSPVQINVAINSTCETFSAKMWGNERKPAKVNRSKEVPSPDMHGTIENKCIGIWGKGCDLVAVLFTHTEGDKKAQTVFAFKADDSGKYHLIGWPTSKDGQFKSVSDFEKANGTKCK